MLYSGQGVLTEVWWPTGMPIGQLPRGKECYGTAANNEAASAIA